MFVIVVTVLVVDVIVIIVVYVSKPLGSGKVRLVQYQPFSLLAMAHASA